MRIERASVLIQEGADTGQTRFGLWFTSHIAALLGTGSVRQQIIHTPRPHIDIPFVWVECEPLIPIDAVEPQPKGHNYNQQQYVERPGNTPMETEKVAGPKYQR